MAGEERFELTNDGIKIRCLNHLATPLNIMPNIVLPCLAKYHSKYSRQEKYSSPSSFRRGIVFSLPEKMKRQTILEHQKRFELLTYRLQGDCTTCCATNANIRRSFRISNKIHFACSLADKTPNPVSQSDLTIRRKFL